MEWNIVLNAIAEKLRFRRLFRFQLRNIRLASATVTFALRTDWLISQMSMAQYCSLREHYSTKLNKARSKPLFGNVVIANK